MPEEVLYITFIAMVAVIIVNIICAINYWKSKKFADTWMELYEKYVFHKRKEFWKDMGAYPAERDGYMYLDLEGARLVIFEGKIDGWYIP